MNIWWIRRDLRLADNPALAAALEGGGGVLPVFILDPQLLDRPAKKRQAFLFDGLRRLHEDLHKLGSGLVLRRGQPAEELAQLVAECGAEAVFAEEDITPYAAQRDKSVAARLRLQLVHGLGVHPPQAIVSAGGNPYKVYTPFNRAWKRLPFSGHTIPAPAGLPPVPDLASEPIPKSPGAAGFPAGEREALRRLEAFLDGPVYGYQDGRSRIDLDGTSVLSPYLRFGMLSARQAVSAARKAQASAPDQEARASCETWQDELIWREFYQYILYYFPHVQKSAFNPAYRALAWRDAPADLQAWKSGQTGYPLVDALMRCLSATGWMHNRGRMIAASFLVKDLLINWQEGERWFMEKLVDGDPAANNGGWQWTAGTGTDAAPYFRILNPVSQALKHDPDGAFTRRWVPELVDVPDEYIHQPWLMPRDQQEKIGVVIGRDYPAPIVEHAEARVRALSFYRRSPA